MQSVALTLLLNQTKGSEASQVTATSKSSTCKELYSSYMSSPDWSGPGPLKVAHLPRLEHTCTSCFPACIGTSCLVRANFIYPKGGRLLGLGPPYPLAIFSSGFLVSSESYQSHAEALAAWGYTVLLYDRQETVADFLNDVTCVRAIRDLIDWCETDPLLSRIADTRNVFLVGHSRGGKLSALAAAQDGRVAALCLIDAVDNTQYAPLGPGFPSAVEALRGGVQLEHEIGSPAVPVEKREPVPVAVVGSGLGGVCAPTESNYSHFFEASRGPAWEVDIRDAGHFSFLDQESPLQRAVCPEGDSDAGAVRHVSQAVMVAWAETMIRQRGIDRLTRGLPPYPEACGGPSTAHSNQVSSTPAPRLPTWGSPLPQFYEDTLGAMKAAPSEKNPLDMVRNLQASLARLDMQSSEKPASASISGSIEQGTEHSKVSRGVIVSERDLELQRSAAEARKRVMASASTSTSEDLHSNDMLFTSKDINTGVDASLRQGLDRMVQRLAMDVKLTGGLRVRFKGFDIT
ncbi:hypothetical protein CEUSTIGMA_g7099.t1 [Chlamydomonas eustigma]|uniref:Chlorophyllase n=1 Tax=Chlamydomonas eustigma TaxID=1157962 RepID=A0A250X9B0_9CHLO|nr:hypothetical protein CEUSTIGMA_g7099.t1 [Chlamydomonas eustigma]|eukprot:GAX79658.1 hypothetical protein CEUSTIGMA_g7099.t1 [Chlamydomonas eustigma]